MRVNPYHCDMDIRSEILKEHSKAQAKKISEFIGNDPSRFAELVALFLNDEKKVAQRAAWILSHCTDIYPLLIRPHLKDLVENLRKTNLHDAIPRNTLRILATQEIPETVKGHLLNLCFDYLMVAKLPVAIKIHAMQIVFNISKNEPDLLNELKMVIEERLPYGTAGFKSRGKKIVKAINKIVK
ncbi:MAG: hypothetical protein AAFZ15_21070 [Bacteroidota bacterium]